MKIHIGCGSKFLIGYKHLDAMPYPHVDYVRNAEDLSVFEDDSIEEIYACHILEHFTRNEIINVLKEWNRVIEPGGLIRIAVPDFEAIVAEYLQSNNLEQVMGLLYGGQNYEYNFHYQAFDYQRLSALLLRSGFENIRRYDLKTFLPEGYDDFSRAYLPHMDFENGHLMSLNIIANKSF